MKGPGNCKQLLNETEKSLKAVLVAEDALQRVSSGASRAGYIDPVSLFFAVFLVLSTLTDPVPLAVLLVLDIDKSSTHRGEGHRCCHSQSESSHPRVPARNQQARRRVLYKHMQTAAHKRDVLQEQTKREAKRGA